MEIKTKNGFRFLYPEQGKYLKKDDVITDYVILGTSADASDWQEITEQEKLAFEQEKEQEQDEMDCRGGEDRGSVAV